MSEVEIDKANSETTDALKDEKKRLKKLETLLETATLSPWERYRALIDEVKHQSDLVEMADRKSRFALVVFAALNALNFIAVARPEMLSGGAAPSTAALAVYITLYAGLSLYVCVQAITALRPRLLRSVQHPTSDGGLAPDPGHEILSVTSISKHSLDAYYELWQRVQFKQINREIAFRLQVTADIIVVKYKALEHLYTGLLALVFLSGFIIIGLTYLRLMA